MRISFPSIPVRSKIVCVRCRRSQTQPPERCKRLHQRRISNAIQRLYSIRVESCRKFSQITTQLNKTNDNEFAYIFCRKVRDHQRRQKARRIAETIDDRVQGGRIVRREIVIVGECYNGDGTIESVRYRHENDTNVRLVRTKRYGQQQKARNDVGCFAEYTIVINIAICVQIQVCLQNMANTLRHIVNETFGKRDSSIFAM